MNLLGPQCIVIINQSSGNGLVPHSPNFDPPNTRVYFSLIVLGVINLSIINRDQSQDRLILSTCVHCACIVLGLAAGVLIISFVLPLIRPIHFGVVIASAR